MVALTRSNISMKRIDIQVQRMYMCVEPEHTRFHAINDQIRTCRLLYVVSFEIQFTICDMLQ